MAADSFADTIRRSMKNQKPLRGRIKSHGDEEAKAAAKKKQEPLR